jgi:serine protease Do
MYSDREDFVVFSTRTEPKDVQPLELGPAPAVNDAVFAVGNALGQSVNSGGPLIDHAARVIGVVLRKSESENLNYALPIERVTASKEGEGRLEGRSAIRLRILDASETLQAHEQFALPMTLPQFYTTVQSLTIEQIE